jgi:histidine triad (HIT) family protein
MSQEQCIFCSIAAHELPAQIIDEDERTVAFMDINPWAKGHALVIPRAHAQDVREIDPDDLRHAMFTARRLVNRMTERLGCEGVALWNSAGVDAGQVVPHFHIHVIPQYAADGPVEIRPREHPDSGELTSVATELIE